MEVVFLGKIVILRVFCTGVSGGEKKSGGPDFLDRLLVLLVDCLLSFPEPTQPMRNGIVQQNKQQ